MRWAAVAVAWLLASPRPANAELADDVRRLTEGVVLEQRALFLFPQSVQTARLSTEGCGRLLLLGSMSLSFDGELTGDEPRLASSYAGVLDFGPICLPPGGRALRVVSPAGRGAVEVLFVRDRAPRPDVYELLGRPTPREPNFGSAPSVPAPRPDAALRFEQSMRREGAEKVQHRQLQGESEALRASLEPGCYRVEVAGEGPPISLRDDIDAEVRLVSAPSEEDGDGEGSDVERVLAQDRSSAAEAALHFCLVSAGEVELRTRGAGARPRRVSIAQFPLRLRVPSELGETGARAALRAFRARGGALPAPTLRQAEFLGAGRTRQRVRARPSCYVAMAAALDGVPRNLVLRVDTFGSEHRDDVRQGDVAASVAFCTQSDGFDVEVDARGPLPAVGFLLYEVRK